MEIAKCYSPVFSKEFTFSMKLLSHVVHAVTGILSLIKSSWGRLKGAGSRVINCGWKSWALY
jgi:hypothetical protein